MHKDKAKEIVNTKTNKAKDKGIKTYMQDDKVHDKDEQKYVHAQGQTKDNGENKDIQS
jgi:hypothetical protein